MLPARFVCLLAVAGLLAGCSGEEAPRRGALRADVEAVGRHFEEAHADLEALLPAREWREAVGGLAGRVDRMDRNEALNGSYDEPLRPAIAEAVTAAAYFGGEDPVLARALRLLRRD